MSRESPMKDRSVHALFLIYLLAICAIEWRTSMLRILYFDELVTLVMAEYKDLPDLGYRLSVGGDNQPAPYYVIVRLFESLPIPDQMAGRLPSLLAYVLTIAIVYVLALRRGGPLVAWVSALLLQFGTRFFAVEARPYALMMGGYALALISWQNAASGTGRGRMASLAGILAGMTLASASHFYSVLLFFPLAAGEAVRTWRSRRIDWPVWLCIGLPAPIPLACLTLMSSMSSYSQHFWAKAKWFSFVGYYLGYAGLVAVPMALAAGACGIVAMAGTRPVSRDSSGEVGGRAFPTHEVVTLFTLACLPIGANLLGMLVTGVFSDRYVLPVHIGLALILGYAIAAGSSRRGLSLTLLLLGLAVAFGHIVRLQHRDMHDDIPNFTRDAARVRGEQDRLGLPLKVSDPNLFFVLRYYRPRDDRHPLQFVGSDELGEKAEGSDTDQRAMRALKKACNLDVELFSEMASRSSDFLYLGVDDSWLVRAMKGRGARVEPLGNYAGRALQRISVATGG
jgi:hypothetical protein